MTRGRWSTAVLVAAVAAGWLLAGCDRSGAGLVDSSTTRPVPTVTSASATSAQAASTATPTTEAIPSTTGAVPLTTGQAGPAGKPLTFRGMTLKPRASWRAGGGGDQVTVVTGGTCRRSAGGLDCPGFLLLGPSQIAIANRLTPYDPEAFWHPGAAVEGCPQDRDGLVEQAPEEPLRRAVATVGGQRASFREWRVPCRDARTGEPEASYRQRVWYLADAGILVVDEWSTPGLGPVLAAARFR